MNKEDLNKEIIFQNGKVLNMFVILSKNKIQDVNSTFLKQYEYRKIKYKEWGDDVF